MSSPTFCLRPESELKECRLSAVNPGTEGLAAKGSPGIPTPGISDGVVVDVSDGDPFGGIFFAFIREIRGTTIIISPDSGSLVSSLSSLALSSNPFSGSSWSLPSSCSSADWPRKIGPIELE